MHLSPLHILIVALVVLVLFGKGKISSMMGEFGKGITAFKKGVNDGTAEIEKDAAAARDVTPPVAADVTPAVAPVDKDKV
ncbi:MAG: twin-arginine translocase TatA/TatE family subunit [Rhodobacteraceae bacterium]|nr:twin-arginine translocase TatA/TatE family subunit [Paracoccaceae bacterium]